MYERPVVMHWDGEVLRPTTRQQALLADELFVVGDLHAIVEYTERDWNSHKHYFAKLKDMWKSWPEAAGEPFPTPEHMRKHALIRCGWADKTEMVFSTAADATIAAALLMPADTYAIIEVNGRVLTRWVAKSQAKRAMGRKEFQKSKWRVLNWVADEIRLPPDDSHRRED